MVDSVWSGVNARPKLDAMTYSHQCPNRIVYVERTRGHRSIVSYRNALSDECWTRNLIVVLPRIAVFSLSQVASRRQKIAIPIIRGNAVPLLRTLYVNTTTMYIKELTTDNAH